MGVVMAVWATPLLARFAPASLPRADQIRIDPGVLAFALAVSAAAGLFFGLAPAWVLARPGLTGPLKLGTGAVTPTGRRLRAALVVAETALVLALLTGAGLLGSSVWRLAHLELGFNPAQVIALQILLPERLASHERASALGRGLLTRVRALPGVVRAATSDELPFASGALSTVGITGDEASHPALVSAVDPDYLQLLEVPLRRGRLLESEDQGNTGVAVVNETLARLFPEKRALGRRIFVASQWREVVGVVGDITEVGQIRGSVIRQAGLSRLTLPAAYVPSGTSFEPYEVFLLLRTPLGASEVARAVRRELHALAPDLTIRRSGTLDARVAASGADVRFQMLVTWIFAGVALSLAAIGLYGVLAHLVGQRTREIGLRITLGATPGQVRSLIARQAVALVGSGAAIGLAVALASGRALRSFLFEVSPVDPLTFVAAFALLLAVAAAAAILPTRRATRVDPSSALRCE
jgi:putative ABC transport system permease protein